MRPLIPLRNIRFMSWSLPSCQFCCQFVLRLAQLGAEPREKKSSNVWKAHGIFARLHFHAFWRKRQETDPKTRSQMLDLGDLKEATQNNQPAPNRLHSGGANVHPRRAFPRWLGQWYTL
jgi:hypothetical protein